MNTQLRTRIYKAIDNALDKAAEADGPLWEEYIHPKLVEQMTDSAALVFDAAQEAQVFQKENDV